MKVAIVADTHFGIRNDDYVLAEALSKFYRDVMFPAMDAAGVERVVHLGDLFDRRKYVNFLTADRCRQDFVQPIADRGLTMDLIIGNHDTYYRSTNSVNSPSIIYADLGDCLRVHGGPTEVDLGSMRTLFVPWICRENAEEVMGAIRASGAKAAMGHLAISGFDMTRGQKCTDGVSAATFEKFSTVLSGHFHTRSKKGNVEYVGSTGQFYWSDYGEKRGFSILDTETGHMEFVENPYDAFVKFHYDDSDPDEVQKKLAEVDVEGKYVKVVVRDKKDLFLFDRAIDILEKSGLRDLQVVDDHRHASDVSDEDVTDSVGVSEDTLDAIVTHVKSLAGDSHPAAVVARAVAMASDFYDRARES